MADETDYVTTLYAVSWVLGSIIIIVCTARICGRAFIIHQAGWDDFFMVLGALAAIVCSSLVTVGASHGLGKHTKDIKDPHDLSEAIKYTIIAPTLSIISSTCSKISIIIFLVRLMGVTAKRWQLFTLWGLSIVMVALNILAIVVIVRFCDPPAKQWDPSLPGTCPSISPQFQSVAGTVQAAYNAFIDIVVAIFPTLVITKLNITRKMKIGLCFLMGGSIFAAVATIVKVYLIEQNLDNHDDITFAWASITLWYTAEMDVLTIVGTAPALWPLFKIFASRNGSYGSNYGPYKNASGHPEPLEGSEAFQLSNSKSSKIRGPATRALQEVDDMRTKVDDCEA
ncbi:uncharacterized protein F4822DRAFT_141699 [Hypoxylon trugodes]|uniref:uncharacterized protein n=1 Tax=Hypoxylon trugodes TaxID=326681 RepID=UPI00219CABF3|nr:uncharacterized protein F4822DRAFT_141699 [Hypoxylon trugodes]KAI1392810.1 hypothetical protein F4822DRAFT_141699 [Hypoxylon trugodes]